MDLTNPTRPRSVAHEDMSLRRGVLSRTVPQRLGKRPTNHRSRPFTVSIVRYHHCTSRFQSPFCFFSFVPDTIVVIPLYLLHCSVTLLFYCSPSAIVLTVDINPSTRYLETSVSTSCLQVSLTCISLVDTSLNTTCLQPCVSSLAPLSLHKRSSDALARLVVPSSSRLTPGRDSLQNKMEGTTYTPSEVTRALRYIPRSLVTSIVNLLCSRGIWVFKYPSARPRTCARQLLYPGCLTP